MPVINPLFDIIPDKEVISVYAAVAPMTEGEPDVINQSVLYSVLSGDDLATNMLAASMDLFTSDVERYFKYGRDHYVDGLPTITTSAQMDQAAMDAALISALTKERNLPPGQEIRLDSTTYDYFYGANIAVAEWLSENTSWDDNDMIIPVGGSTQYPTAALLWQMQPENTVIRTQSGIRTYWDIDEGGDGTYEQTFQLQFIPDKYTLQEIPPYDPSVDVITPEGLFYMARYYVIDSATQTPVREAAYYFIYKSGSGQYPELDVIYETVPNTEVYPIVAARVDHNDYCNPANAGTPRYDTTKKLLDIIGINIQEVYDGIIANPDQAEVDHVYTLLGVNFTDTRESSISYLWYWAEFYHEHFGFMSRASALAQYDEFIISTQSTTYWADIHFGTITKSTVARNGPVGTYAKEYVHNPIKDKWGVKLYKQTSSTEALCYHVTDIICYINVYGAKDTWHEMRLDPEATDQLVTVPIQRDIVMLLPRLVRNDMLYTTYHTAFHAYHIEHIEWYQDGFLALVVAIVGIFIPGFTGWDDFIASIAVGGAAGITSFAVYVGEMFLKSLAISISSIVIGKAFGIEGLVVAAAALWWFTSPGIGAPDWMPDIWGAITSGGPAQGWITGEITQSIVKIKVDELNVQMEQIQAELKEEQEAAYALWQQAQPPFRLDPLGLYTAIDMTPYDSPATYIGRKTNSTQLSQMCGYDAIVNFYDNQLDLYPV